MFKLAKYVLPIAVMFSSTTFGQAQTTTLTIPKALQAEHHELFEALETATKAGGKAGEAAKRAMAVLKPHFEKEERFALPQLGALETLTKKDASIPADLRDDLIKRADAFRAELPKMLEEHKQISTALHEMRDAAEQEKKDDLIELAEMISAHAAMEEQVLYPASLLIGEYAKAIATKK
jgi:hemerythrin